MPKASSRVDVKASCHTFAVSLNEPPRQRIRFRHRQKDDAPRTTRHHHGMLPACGSSQGEGGHFLGRRCTVPINGRPSSETEQTLYLDADTNAPRGFQELPSFEHESRPEYQPMLRCRLSITYTSDFNYEGADNELMVLLMEDPVG